MIFGDVQRTQRLANARLEVVDGPTAGIVADFNPSTGIYVLGNLPGGFVQVRVSADAFRSVTATVSVGARVTNEFVLQRQNPLPDAVDTLGGLIYAYPSKPGDSSFSAWGGVKVEILDGPLTGIFTFSDDDFGTYQFSGVPHGPIHVRASADWLKPQTLEVVVAGNTKLDFVMVKR